MVMGLVRRMAADQTREQDQAALIAAARRGSADALGAMYDRHAGPLLAIAYRLLQSRADAEDVVHDVFVGLPELLRKYEERGALGAWLKTVTARVALARLRELSRQSHEDPDQFPRAAQDLDAAITLEAALRTLSPALRAVLVLKEIEGFSHAEVARMLDISTGASEVRLHRALQQLRAMLRTGD